MGNGISKKRNCGRCNETIYDKSGREIVVIDHWIYCNQKTETRMNELRTNNRIDSLRSEISDLQKRLSVSNEAKYKSENLVALYKRTCSTEASKFQNTIRIKDSEIEGLKEMLTKNSHRIKNQTLNLNGIQKRHQESLQKNRELENKVSQLQRQLKSEKKLRASRELQAAKEPKAAKKQKSPENQSDSIELVTIISEMQERLNEYEDIINKRDDANDSTKACSVCYEEINENKKLMAFGPCGHQVCRTCSGSIRKEPGGKKCPLCRSTINYYLKLEGIY